MKMPFPGMDPYLEHPALWPGVHTRLAVALANQLGPRVRPHYVVSVEDRVFIDRLRVRYGEPCEPALTPEDQQWANERWAAYRAAHPDLFPPQGN